jgi:hypothetical protein
MTKISIAKAIKLINPDARVSVDDDNYDTIEWLFDTPIIPKSEIDAKIVEEETAYENAKQEKINLKASAKAKLIAGEPLTEEEADTIVL